MSEQNHSNSIFTEEQKNNFAGFAMILGRIHKRLIAEGYTIKDGKIIPPEVQSNKVHI
ncbi:MAG: hypothetical protein HYV32_03095 [Candidatus Kerfeldbacteria bacterium]|nr:hypothetical protein [Candidatus Kerfeldbacteria bacterium]